MRPIQSQFEIIIDFMEKHGDLSVTPSGSRAKGQYLRRWTELTNLLNAKGEKKSMQKWRKAWSDFKNNAKKKYERIHLEGDGPELNENEKRLLRIIGWTQNKKRRRSINWINKNSVDVFKVENDADSYEGLQSQPEHNFCSVEADNLNSQNSSSSSSSKASNSSSSKTKKRKFTQSEEIIKELTDKFIAFEKERERQAQERELARIQQNEKIISVLDRFVSVIESLAPSIQSYLERNLNEGG